MSESTNGSLEVNLHRELRVGDVVTATQVNVAGLLTDAELIATQANTVMDILLKQSESNQVLLR